MSMQLPKLSRLFLCTILLSWSCWGVAAIDAQQISSRKGYLNRALSVDASKPIKKVRTKSSPPIRVDRTFGQWQTSFLTQEKDSGPPNSGPTGSSTELNQPGEVADQKSDQTDETSQRQIDSNIDSLKDTLEDTPDDGLEDDLVDEDLDDLDLDTETERRPPRPMFGAWHKKDIRGVSIDIRETNRNTPEDRSHQLLNSSRSDWTQFHPQPKVFAWAAPDIKYQPLYFEDVPLERYGTTAGPYRQSVISAFYFFADFVLLPHKFRHDCPKDCDHPLGFCRPGNSTPYSIQRHYFGRPGR